MKFWKKLLAAQLSVTMLTGAAAVAPMNMTVAAAVDEESASTDGTTGECKWHFDSDTRTLTVSGKGKMADYSISNDTPWYSFASSLKAVVIGDGVTYVGQRAFASGKYTDVTLSDSVIRLGANSFQSGSVTNVRFGKNVQVIGDSAFANAKFTAVTLPSSLTELGKSVFSSCPNLTRITIPNKCTSSLNDTFRNSRALSEVTIGTGVTGCDRGAFFCCSVKKFTVSAANASLKSIDGSLYTKDGSRLICYHKADSPTAFTVPESVTEIGDYAFYGNSAVQTLTLTKNLRKIGYMAFYNASVSTIQFNAPALEEIGQNAFRSTPWYNKRPDGVVYAGTVAYGYKGDAPSTVYIKSKTLGIADNAFEGMEQLESVSLPVSLRRIGKNAFCQCTALQSATLKKDLQSIGESAFQGCAALENVDFPEGLTTLEASAFMECTSLTKVILPDSLTELGHDCFYKCKNLQKLKIGQGITKIPYWCFGYNRSLQDIYIPENVREIEYCAFAGVDAPVTVLNSDIVFGEQPFGNLWGNPLYGIKGSTAEAYAEEVGRSFVPVTNIKGDANFDGKVNVHDVTDVQRAAAEYITLSPQALINADVTQNGKADIEDATAIQRCCAEFTSSL